MIRSYLSLVRKRAILLAKFRTSATKAPPIGSLRSSLPIRSMIVAAAFVVAVSLPCLAQPSTPPSSSTVSATPNRFSVGNQWFQAVGTAQDGHWAGLHIMDRATGRSIQLPEAFSLKLKNGAILRSSAMKVTQPFHIQKLQSNPDASRYAEGLSGSEVCATFSSPTSQIEVDWCGTLRQGSHYFRQKVTLRAGSRTLPITQVRLLQFHDEGARVDGMVKGSPIVDGTMYFGFEHPLSVSRVQKGEVLAYLPRKLPLRAGESVAYSSVIGVAQPGQMRRAFFRYVERERAHPYRPFLQYNSWFDLGANQRYDQAAALNRIHAFGKELTEKRGVTVQSFVLDDGWDNPKTLWSFDSGFPDGFTNVSEAAAKYHSHIGVWLSPWGGYNKTKEERLAYGRKHGYKIVNGGFALSGPKYYTAFQQACLDMIRRYDVNEFKFDGTGNADQVVPGSHFDSDFDAMIHLIDRLRRSKPNLFIDVSTGAAPSPFWLFSADVIGRGGEDYSYAGVGSRRQRWITYLDSEIYKEVQQGPLFPINSLMLQAVIYARLAPGLDTDPDHDFPDAVKAFFGTGTQIQEMYITPSLLSQSDWDILARAAKWSLRNASTLEDSHWIGGDPAKLQVYGWAAWSPKKAIVTLRNPSDKPQTYMLDLKKALQLPADAPRNYLSHDPWSDSAHTTRLNAGHPIQVTLKPWEIRTLDAVPVAQ